MKEHRVSDVLIVDAVRANDVRTGLQLFTRLEYGLRSDISVNYGEVSSAGALRDMLIDWASRWRGNWPLLHLECHGSAEGVQIGDDAKLLEWATFSDVLRPLNVQCHNRLTLLVAACESFNPLRLVGFDNVAAFFMLIASSKPILASNVFDGCAAFYESLHKTHDLDVALRALETHWKSDAFFMTCEQAFMLVFEEYKRLFIDNPEGLQFQGDLVHGLLTAQGHSAGRSHFEGALSDAGSLFDLLRRRFLMIDSESEASRYTWGYADLLSGAFREK